MQANAAVQSPRLHPVVQSAEVPHRQLSGQLESMEKRAHPRKQSKIHSQHPMQPLNNPLQGVAQPSTAAGLQAHVSQRSETNNQPIDLTDD